MQQHFRNFRKNTIRMKRSSPWLTIFGALGLFLMLCGWAFSSPVGSTPDSAFHLASAWCGQGERDGLCEAGSIEQSRLVPEKALVAPCYSEDNATDASCQEEVFNVAGSNLIETIQLNSGTQYPPGFYYVMSLFAGENFILSVLIMRVVNAALFTALVTATALLLPRAMRFILLGSAALTLVPIGLFTIASVNPSSWAITANVVLFPALLGFMFTSGKTRWALAGVSTFALLLSVSSRGDSAAFSIVAVLAAAVMAFRKEKQYWMSLVLPLVMILAAAFAFLSAGQTSLAVAGDMNTEPTEHELTPAAFAVINLLELPTLWAGVFGGGGGLGWLDTPLPAVTTTTAGVLFAAILFAALRTIEWRKALALAGVGIALIVFPVVVLVQSQSIVGENVQPRYILPLMTIFLAVALTPATAPLRASLATASGSDGQHNFAITNSVQAQPLLSNLQIIFTAVGLAGAQALALFYNLKRYVTGGSYNIIAATDWWWISSPGPFPFFIFATLTGAVTCAIFAVATKHSLAASALLVSQTEKKHLQTV